ncbi:MAG: type II secretion system F family protein [Candidatus Levybacteria bacterium]|nr:type II secretion system F family protein [Candidatus Levybacteria bacterium]
MQLFNNSNPKSIRISSTEKLGLVSNMATMLSAGIPILEVVDSLLEDAKGSQKKFLESLKADLAQGNHVADALAKFPRIFDKITVNLIKASEEAGTLDVTLTDLKSSIKKDAEFSDKIKGALTYPVLIFFVFIGVLLMILVVVVPKISSVFSRLDVPLPLPTQILIFMSKILTEYTVFAAIGILILVVLIFLAYREKKREFMHILFMLPLVSTLAQLIDLTRFSRSLYLLLNAGIPIAAALELAQEVVLKKEVAKAIGHCKDVVLAGSELSLGLKNAKNIFPNIMIKITEAGEKSGSLDKSMQDVSEYLDYQVDKTLKTLTTMLEPIMLIVVGTLVGGMMLSIIAPIYGLIGQVSAR